jgi:ribose 5-phosphate isomerase B
LFCYYQQGYSLMPPFREGELQDIIRGVIQQTLAEYGPRVSTQLSKDSPPSTAVSQNKPDETRRVLAIGSDHGGFEMKKALKKHLSDLNYEVIDCGTTDKTSVDYPDFAHAVALLVSQGKAWRGIVIDGAGVGSCMVANKVPGIRAALCYDNATALNSREHNDANVLTLGAGLIGENLAMQIVDTWLATAFLGGRHARRVDKIMAVEKQYLKSGN